MKKSDNPNTSQSKKSKMDIKGISLFGNLFTKAIITQAIKISQKQNKHNKINRLSLFQSLQQLKSSVSPHDFLFILSNELELNATRNIQLDTQPTQFIEIEDFKLFAQNDHLILCHRFANQVHMSMIDFDLSQIFDHPPAKYSSPAQSIKISDPFKSFEIMYALFKLKDLSEIKEIAISHQKKQKEKLKNLAKTIHIELGHFVLNQNQKSLYHDIQNAKISLTSFYLALIKITNRLIFILQAEAYGCSQPPTFNIFDNSIIPISQQDLSTYLQLMRDLSQEIDYQCLEPEVLGQIYEELLSLSPKLTANDTIIHLSLELGLDRKKTGTYFTHNTLVDALINQAIDFKINELSLKHDPTSHEQRIKSILNLKICDPASGSGNLLLAVARKLSLHIISYQSHHTYTKIPIIDALQQMIHHRQFILQQVIRACLYAVDAQENAIELCQLSMWLEGRFYDQPFDFLKHQMKCGNALIGDIRHITQKYTEILDLEKESFSWEEAFPEIFKATSQNGFDVIVGNPPWERLQCVDEKQLKYFRNHPQYEKTSKGDLNLYALFAERSIDLLNTTGVYSLILPTGIATDHGNQKFFTNLIKTQKLVSLFDFENRKKLFIDVDSRFKFSIMTVSHKNNQTTKFAFFLNHTSDLQNSNRIFELTANDFLMLNPNTQTCPIFRHRLDADITKKIYQKNPIFINENRQSPKSNPWQITFKQGFFNMTTHKPLFEINPKRISANQSHLPLYEAKMLHLYDHRYASYNLQTHQFDYLSLQDQQNPDFSPQPRYWVHAKHLPVQVKDQWLIAFRNISRSTDKRTAIFTIIPKTAVGNSCGLLFLKQKSFLKLIFTSICASIPFDYIVRQKLGGTNLNFHYFKQLPMLPPSLFNHKKQHTLSRYFPNQSILEIILPNILELFYTAKDLNCVCINLLNDLQKIDIALIQKIYQQWCINQQVLSLSTDVQTMISQISQTPFKWDILRRMDLKTQLDVIYAKLFQFNLQDLSYILDPSSHAYINPQEEFVDSFRVLKNEEMKLFNEFKTKNLILWYWEKFFGENQN